MNGEDYSLPLSFDILQEQGWSIYQGAFSNAVSEVGSEPVTLQLSQDDDIIGEVRLVSPTGETVPIDEGMVVGLSLNNRYSWEYDFYLPGSIGLYDSSYYIENTLNENNIPWQKTGNNAGTTYTITNEVDNGTGFNQYELRIELQDDTVTRITMQLKEGEIG